MAGTLCLDVGSGTQDALLWLPDAPLENCPKFVLPSPSKLVAARIRALTARGAAIHLCGTNMGGGFFGAVRAHLAAGLPVSAHPEAALAASDDPARLAAQGVTLKERPDPGSVCVHLADFDPGFWRGLLAQCGLDWPDVVLAAVQDHGHDPNGSNRVLRFRLWERFLRQNDADPARLLYDVPPPELTRLAALQRATGGHPVMDTGPAAALGALADPEVTKRMEGQGALLLNMGNSHILGLLLFAGHIFGVYEHHTGLIAPPELAAHLERFRRGALADDTVRAGGGHGCLTLELPREAAGFPHLFVIGPRRADFQAENAVFPAPGGDMMLTGCFGLLSAWLRRNPVR
ncbi:DUF1786 family protein [Fundidesulfovibrio butyratiphilus]